MGLTHIKIEWYCPVNETGSGDDASNRGPKHFQNVEGPA